MKYRARKRLVDQVLRDNPKASIKYLIVNVWKRELSEEGHSFTPENILLYASSPSGIDRDRRRPDMLKKYPRDEENYKKYQSFRDEFNTRPMVRQLRLVE